MTAKGQGIVAAMFTYALTSALMRGVWVMRRARMVGRDEPAYWWISAIFAVAAIGLWVFSWRLLARSRRAQARLEADVPRGLDGEAGTSRTDSARS